MSDADSKPEPPDEDQVEYKYGHGGVPTLLVFLYIGFLILGLFYILDHLIPSWWRLDWHVRP
ncbi:MAG: hypothetical protein EYC70_02365 [Planctomycetota bacterium]|nr:MAG: hypothetical protein EYC70_02365 [Planctomycetota bacterium]